MYINSTLYARISPQWFCRLGRLWPNVSWQVASCELVSEKAPTLCLVGGIVSPLWLHWVKGVRMSRCNLPPALLEKWLGYFTCHCGNTGVEQTQNKSHHTKFTLGKKISPLLLPGFKLAIFQSRVWRSCQQAIAAPCVDMMDTQMTKTNEKTEPSVDSLQNKKI